MKKALLFVALTFLFICVVIATLWGSLAIWFRLPLADLWRVAIATGFAAFGIGTSITLFTYRRWHSLGAFAVVFAALLIWWNSITPWAEADFAPDVARQVTGDIKGNTLTLTNLRNFNWTTDGAPIPNWETRTFDLSTLQSADVFMSYWAGPAMAHVIVSFGFADGEYLAWSVEVRREKDSEFSPVADFFKEHTLVIIAASERDVVGVRSNIRGEDVQLYRLNMPTKLARDVLENYVRASNRLAQKPHFYNSLTTNCTTVVFALVDAITQSVPMDLRILVNGYLPEYLFEIGSLPDGYDISDLRAQSHIRDAALAAGLGDAYSNAIRVGVPAP